jgi:hypothetical protein
MSKKSKTQAEQPQTDQAPAQAAAPEIAPTPEKEVTNAQIWTFWLGVASAVVIARVLNYALPGISESVIERWVMLGFGVFMALFLIKLK